MSLILRKSLAPNAAQARIMDQQWQELCNLRANSEGDVVELLSMTLNRDLQGNAARTPAEAYREFDQTTKIDMVPAGEFATLTRLMQKSRSVSIGREVFEYRKASDAGNGQSSMSGQIGIKMDHVDYKYAGTVVPVHDLAFGRRWREVESMRAEGFDALVDDSRESERELMRTIENYLWDGNANLDIKGNKWLGIKADPSVAQSTLTADLSAAATTADAIRVEVAAQRDVLYIANNCTNPLRLGVSREIMSNWERPFSTAEGMFGTIGEYVAKLRGIAEIYEDSRLVGNEIVMYWDDQQGFHPVVGMGLSTYATPRVNHNDDFKFIKWAAVGFLAKTDYEGRKCALYGS